MESIGFICFVGLTLIFAAVGGFALWTYFKDRQKAEASKQWMAVNGRVVESRVEVREGYDEDQGTTRSYAPHVEYEYEVNGTVYRSTKLQAGTRVFVSSRGRAEAEVARYAPGTPVTVYCDPANPAEAVLQPGKSSKAGLVIGIVFLVISGMILCLFLITVLIGAAAK
ncbi:DUF3592 domain-containing protein [Anaerolinea thermophila]|uniref:DUF3592 domain-containing protein n=1 Tax=Anaerolinea thermophila (strain DSM 14523 / JCM 11388 / NBRC 100420 / UNI-1) TaxID=926569 RepID=E8N251_ANATU|nr:DUF3592 domain-containing protein [Anaerolinea thermophila]BAJ64998.1 hypothetical protein ANT_29720 [Anaerolinea thermophila UNI-1]